MVNLKSYRKLFIVITLVLTLVAASPTLATVTSFQGGSENFSEFWLLGPNHIAANYPFNVNDNETYKIFVDLANHMGRSEYYMVQVKFRNITQSVIELSSSKPSSLPTLYEFRFSVLDENVWESPVNFAFQDVSVEGDVVTVGDVIVNGMVFPVDVSAHRDSVSNSFYFQLFFELWRYDLALKSFKYDNRFVGIWFNMTTSQ